jgi:hypothetical protein
METYEPLTPPEIQRDDATGRFERKGMLAKAAKFKQDQPAKRRPGGKPFQPGVSGNPAGKPRGTLNRTTLALKEAILAAGDAAGGEGGLVAYLTRLAIENSSALRDSLARYCPTRSLRLIQTAAWACNWFSAGRSSGQMAGARSRA